MARKRRQRISYVLPLASTPGGHRLGVNGLSFDQDRSILYTGGRDGVICAWDLNLDSPNSTQQSESDPATQTTASFRRQVQAHTHWVNDTVLVKNNLAVVSASSDASVKLWRPHSHDATAAYSIGSHSDYVKCLSSPGRGSNWVASSGLDGRICLWDLAGAGQNLEINLKKADNVEKSSIYALKATESLLVSGGPEGVVRIWDVRSGKSITKLVGHTDIVRDFLISDDGDTILSASSDQTIKVWSISVGRCVHTLTMHNDSVWSLYSDDPYLSVFYSGDKSGLVAKTDTRRAIEIDDGVSVALCQENDGIARLAVTGDYVWTATSSSSINRWKDVDTELKVETPPPSPRHERRPSALSRSIRSATPESPNDEQSPSTDSKPNTIPHNAVLLLSNTAVHPGRKSERSYSTTNIRKSSEALLNHEIIFVVPIRGRPEETIQGQNGLREHVMLNDKKRCLTVDTAGEVVLWDLLKCVPIKSLGRRRLDEIVPHVNTIESVSNWCTVDTETGRLTVTLEENYCFDAEVYADEIDIPEKIDFREDQRINLGKWVLRNLFSSLLDEEIRRDEDFRQNLRSQSNANNSGGIQRLGAPTRIALPNVNARSPMVSPGTLVTPRAHPAGFAPFTPGLAIGIATPGVAPSLNGHSPLSQRLSPTAEEGPDLEQSKSRQNTTNGEGTHDYFSVTSNPPAKDSLETPSEANAPTSPLPTDTTTVTSPTSPSDDRKKGAFFGKKFNMTFPKKLARPSPEIPKNPAITTEDRSEESDQSSDKDDPQLKVEDNFFGVLQKIRQRYSEHAESESNQPPPAGITPSLPMETPVLKPPPHTLIIIQEDDPEAGGLADQYRGEVSELGREADTLEKLAPMWLGDLLLRNELPPKDTIKVSFVLLPWENKLPALAAPSESNARLNANRMLRAKKIMAYVAERIEAPVPNAPNGTSSNTQNIEDPFVDEELKPEQYLELLCQGQKVDPNMTLGTLRVHVWRTGGDVVLYYKANGRKQIRPPHPIDIAGREEATASQLNTA